MKAQDVEQEQGRKAKKEATTDLKYHSNYAKRLLKALIKYFINK